MFYIQHFDRYWAWFFSADSTVISDLLLFLCVFILSFQVCSSIDDINLFRGLMYGIVFFSDKKSDTACIVECAADLSRVCNV